jgi:hypothetical protein
MPALLGHRKTAPKKDCGKRHANAKNATGLPKTKPCPLARVSREYGAKVKGSERLLNGTKKTHFSFFAVF